MCCFPPPTSPKRPRGSCRFKNASKENCDTQDRNSGTGRRADRPTDREREHLLVVVAEGVRDAEFGHVHQSRFSIPSW